MTHRLAITLAVASLATPSIARAQATRQSFRPDSLRAAIESRIAAIPGAVVSVALRDLATGASLDVARDSVFHAASTMKVPVMFELYRQADRGAFDLAQPLLLVNQFGSIVDGSPYSLSPGEDSDSSMYAMAGTRVPADVLIRHMITRSSNLATNAVIALVGATNVTATARTLGATHTQVLRGVEDQKAFDRGLNNVTTAADLATLLVALERRQVASPASTSRMRDILLAQEFNGDIPAGLPPGTRVAHKTGEITAVRHDAAIVYPPGRAPYVLVVLTRGMHDQAVAQSLISELSRIVWTELISNAAY
jgi:beta-lactamase class A